MLLMFLLLLACPSQEDRVFCKRLCDASDAAYSGTVVLLSGGLECHCRVFARSVVVAPACSEVPDAPR